jgi:hypothetical protein
MKAVLAACCVIVLAAFTISADIAKPPKPADKPGKLVLRTSLEIAPDSKVYEARLQISESNLKSLQASLNGTVQGTTMIAQSPTRTIIAGVLMFLSISVAGVLLARRTQKAVAVVIVLAAVLGSAAIITRGNAAPPGSYRWRNLPQALADGKSTFGNVDIEIVPDDALQGKSMRLIIPLQKQNRPGEE